jgi:TIR domain
VRNQLTARLTAHGYAVLVDSEKLLPGQDWAPELYGWLADCHGAVILLTGKALDSFWVRREVNILLWRRSLNPAFPVIPALLGIDAADVEAAGFEELGPVQAASSAGVSPADAEALIDAVMARFPPVPPGRGRDPLQRWIRDIARALNTVAPADRDVLEEAGLELGLPSDLPVDWAHEDACLLLAAQLLGKGLPGMRLLRAMSDLSRGMDGAPFGRLVPSVLPSWVDAEAARLVLPPRRDEDPIRMTVLLDVTAMEVAVDYVARAMCQGDKDNNFECLTIQVGPNAEATADEVLATCIAAVRGVLTLPPRMRLSVDVPRIPGKVYYLLLHPDSAPPAAVAEAAVRLHDECPWLIVVVLGDGSRITVDMLVQAGATAVIRIEPALDPNDELLATQLRRDIVMLADRTYGLRRLL